MKTDEALKFAQSIVVSHAEVTDGDVQPVKDARWNDGEQGWDGSH